MRPCFPRYKIRIRGENPNHHLWNNHGIWFVYYTVHPTASTKERIRRSLGTRDLAAARMMRDRFFEELRASASLAQDAGQSPGFFCAPPLPSNSIPETETGGSPPVESRVALPEPVAT